MEKVSSIADGSRIHSLDGLRAVAVSIVVAAHFTQIHAIPGGFGVTIFFAISGFIITRLLLGELQRSTSVDFIAFYKRRVFRLIPAIIVTLIVAAAVQGMLGKDWVTWDRALASVLFAQNYYLAGSFNGPLTQHWSLAVEEHFYIGFPIVLACLCTLGWRKVLAGLFILCLVSFCFRLGYALALEPKIASEYTYRASECRIENILWGCILAVVAQSQRYQHIVDQITRTRLPGRRCSGSLSSFSWRASSSGTTSSDQQLATRSRVPLSLSSWRTSCLRSVPIFSAGHLTCRRLSGSAGNLPPVVWIGRLSFSIYLLHAIMNHVAAYFLPSGPQDWQSWPFAVALTLLASWACYAFVEQPMIRLGKRVKVRRMLATAGG